MATFSDIKKNKNLSNEDDFWKHIDSDYFIEREYLDRSRPDISHIYNVLDKKGLYIGEIPPKMSMNDRLAKGYCWDFYSRPFLDSFRNRFVNKWERYLKANNKIKEKSIKKATKEDLINININKILGTVKDNRSLTEFWTLKSGRRFKVLKSKLSNELKDNLLDLSSWKMDIIEKRFAVFSKKGIDLILVFVIDLPVPVFFSWYLKTPSEFKKMLSKAKRIVDSAKKGNALSTKNDNSQSNSEKKTMFLLNNLNDTDALVEKLILTDTLGNTYFIDASNGDYVNFDFEETVLNKKSEIVKCPALEIELESGMFIVHLLRGNGFKQIKNSNGLPIIYQDLYFNLGSKEYSAFSLIDGIEKTYPYYWFSTKDFETDSFAVPTKLFSTRGFFQYDTAPRTYRNYYEIFYGHIKPDKTDSGNVSVEACVYNFDKYYYDELKEVVVKIKDVNLSKEGEESTSIIEKYIGEFLSLKNNHITVKFIDEKNRKKIRNKYLKLVHPDVLKGSKLENYSNELTSAIIRLTEIFTSIFETKSITLKEKTDFEKIEKKFCGSNNYSKNLK